MKVKSKIILLTVISILITVVLTTLIVRTILIKNIDSQETIQTDENYKRAIAVFQKEEATLESSVLDWAKWDDTYIFMQDRNQEYIDSNLQDSTMKFLDLNFIIYIDTNGKIVRSKLYDWISADQETFLTELEKSLKLKDEFKRLQSVTKPVTGTLVISGIPVFISISPITTSDGKASVNGIFIMGKIINDDFINYIEEILQVNVKMVDVHSQDYKDIINQDFKNSFNSYKIWIKRNKNEINSYSLLNDIYGRTENLLMLNFERESYKNQMEIITQFGILFIIGFSIMGTIAVSILQKIITNRLNSLHTFMEKVATSLDTKTRIYMSGNDEISRLAVNANIMLEELDRYYSKTKIMEERFKLIMEATNDGYFDVNIPQNEIYISNAWLTYMGYEANGGFISLERVDERIYFEDKELFLRASQECLDGKTEYLKVEYRAKKKSGELLWVEVRGKIVEFEIEKPIRFIGTLSDITSRKKYEEENIYLSQTDVTTGLKNRAYMEKIIKISDECTTCSSWIIIGDVNGLKLINDTFGHQEGDRLLQIVGNIFKKCCSKNDIPARWGGDEFVIFIKDDDEAYVESLIINIKKECDEVTNYPIKISIALGRAQKDKKNSDMDTVLKTAEERMYRNKLLESRSARSAILASLEQTLHEKHIETEEHTKRIKHICLLIGTRMGLNQDELDELTLLGSLHDIGKIGIPEDILLKPGKLNKDEWEIMKSHTEIGYRIASATPELVHIADEILYHHEKYDGTGYPQGLQGKNIPKLSRLINIVDSFDVMTNDRCYKKAMSLESVIQELKDCSDKQFDPEMVELFLALIDDTPTISSFTL